METFSKAEVMFLKADSKLQNGHYKEGIQILEELLKESPDFAPAYNHMGWLYFVHLSDLTKAEGFFKKTIKLDPAYPPVYPNYAALLNAMDRHEELENLINTALDIENVDVAALHYERATMNEVKQDYVKAEESLRKAIQYSLSNSDVRFYSEALERVVMKKSLLS
ncbi:tetratricopeptide repeat protein [Leptobacterium flavescens]|uniref:Tetratricopeptide repeat protein n=1 Tax=Leptobacterium flavescens TaxID=472055 RepID=A0A6P0UJM2_9FLAO|nr:tetratricopeptide repeat protein [Leptobacterium flavescens]NER12069.1 tetratricopeptide repeat protein [Leptobacterium flavescens]